MKKIAAAYEKPSLNRLGKKRDLGGEKIRKQRTKRPSHQTQKKRAAYRKSGDLHSEKKRKGTAQQ